MENNFNFEVINENETSISRIKEYLKKALEYSQRKETSNNIKDIYNEGSVYILEKFIDNISIINKKSYLIAFIEILIKILNSGNNILIPFLKITPILINSYIECDIDEENNLYYIEIFKLLKINCFISRENLYPIYEYFSNIYHNLNTIEENDIRLKKFNKVFELWKIFYNFNIDEKNLKDINSSAFCFIGHGLEIKLSQEIRLENYEIIIEIIILNKLFFDLNKNAKTLKIKNALSSFTLDFSLIKDLIEENKKFKNNKENIIKIVIKYKIVILKIISQKDSEKYYENAYTNHIEYIKNFFILEGFYGQITGLHLKLKQNKNIIIKSSYVPYPLADNYNIEILSNCPNNIKNQNEITKSDINKQLFFKIEKNYNCVKPNYINYLENKYNNFNLIEYFGGFTPLVPFISVINGLFSNKNIKVINGISKNKYLRDVLFDIFDLFLTLLENNKNNNSEQISQIISNYKLFFFTLILQINIEIFKDNEEKHNKFNKIFSSIQKFDDKAKLISNIFLKIFNESKDSLYKDILNFKNIIIDNLKNNYVNLKNDLNIKYTYNQLYRKIMKELFIYNRYWSKKELFFKKDKKNNDESNLKYKLLSSYTKSFQQPLLYPILEFDEYLPTFSKFNKENLFKHKLNETINYNFNLKSNVILELIKDNDPIKKLDKKYSCLIKKNYHVPGEIFIIKGKKIGGKFKILFCANDELISMTCNKIKKNNPSKNNKPIINNGRCYGSNFPCLKKEFNRKILIKSNDIRFILIRNYYRKTSGLEIFTYKNNKSYYFNFQEKIVYNVPEKNSKNKINKNIILNEVINNTNFEILTLKKEITLFYNKNYENNIFPLLLEKNSWNNKLYFYNNFDLLIIINLLSNRSFKDLYQYPVFPNLYKVINILDKNKKQERNLGEHLGIQDLSEKSKDRKILIEDSYNHLIEEKKYKNKFKKDNDDKGKYENTSLFNCHYSNPVYTCYYLIRIFPYSLSSIEFQGEGFDSANRLFYSITNSFKSTLEQKSDLREMIPEIYYFPDLYYNINELEFGKLLNGDDIDTIYVQNKNENNLEKYKFITNLKNYFESNTIKLNLWINLIFGINQRCTSDRKIYFPEYMYIHFDEEQKKDLNNPLLMQMYEFGVQPYQLFDTKFQNLINKSKYSKEIKNFNREQFQKEHIIIEGNKDKCFQCEGYNCISTEYIDIINKKVLNNKINPLFFHYIFIGDLLGNIIIYKIKEKTQNNMPPDYKIMKKLTDHYKQIKYIDYNPRLNLFLSYSLDGFINIYVFPKCKLVRVIKVSEFTDSNQILEKVVLVSNPFPMIFTYDKKNIYSLTLNGELIEKKNIKIQFVDICPCVDKNCGLINDCVYLNKNNGGLVEITLPLLEFT